MFVENVEPESGEDYVKSLVARVLQTRWSASSALQLVTMFRELSSLSTEHFKEVINKALRYVR